MEILRPKRGDVWWVNFNPSVGSEIKKKRPAIVLSNDSANKYLNRVQVVPLTSNIDRVYPSECILTVKKQTCKAMADQIKTVSIDRMHKRVSKISTGELQAVEQVVKVQLGLD